ncbi:MAG: hypothetical protein KKD77_20955 [Gammaproteobacteria bacterium]|uniref:Putative tail tape measure protein n=1 Tax=viral metagenome TaxID=1070528 RepID=A0A6M3JTM8_9ZZZZ|nr:hypothetical protein [Gammaproteobacteria bacterium]
MNLIDKCYYGIGIFAKGGGGGGAGVVDYPAYMKTFHGQILDHNGVDTPTISLMDAMNAAFGNSPYAGEVAYDPDADIAAMIASVTANQALVTLLSTGTGLDTLVSGVLDHARVDLAVTEFANDLSDRLLAEVVPRFEAGMRDINAVSSSAFAVGRAILEVAQTRQVAKFSADLHMKAFSDDALRLIALKLEYQKFATHYIAEANRIKIVAKGEELESNLEIGEADATWDLEVFQHGGNLLAGIGGGVMTSNKKKKNKAASAIGGAMTGAAAGAVVGAEIGSVGSGYGALIGAVLGAAIGFLSE